MRVMWLQRLENRWPLPFFFSKIKEGGFKRPLRRLELFSSDFSIKSMRGSDDDMFSNQYY